MTDRASSFPLASALVAQAVASLPAEGRAAAASRYRVEPDSYFAELEGEIERIVAVEGRSLEDCLRDLDAFAALTEETENDAWYDQRAAFVSMHLDFLLLGFSRRRLDALATHVRDLAPEGAGTLCDVGSGCGRLAAMLLSERPELHATLVDKSVAARGYAGAYLEARGAAARARVVSGDLLALPARDGEFDIVIAAEVLEHTTDAERAAHELVRVTKPGGLLCLSVPVDLAIAMHPVVFASEADVLALFAPLPLRVARSELVRPVPGLDAICQVFPEFVGCVHASFVRTA